MKTNILACANCENEFNARRSDAIYCSNACRQQSFMARKVRHYSGEISSNRNPGKATILLLLQLNEVFFMFAGDTISKSQVEALLQTDSEINELAFTNLPDHKTLQNEIQKLCHLLLEVMDRSKAATIQTEIIKKSAGKFLGSLKSHSRLIASKSNSQ